MADHPDLIICWTQTSVPTLQYERLTTENFEMLVIHRNKTHGKNNRKNIWIFVKALVLVPLIIGIKFLAHAYGLEFLAINNLFSGIIAANVFLMGFLLSGVLSDYKESEKIPG